MAVKVSEGLRGVKLAPTAARLPRDGAPFFLEPFE
jgi:hypothetical protein